MGRCIHTRLTLKMLSQPWSHLSKGAKCVKNKFSLILLCDAMRWPFRVICMPLCPGTGTGTGCGTGCGCGCGCGSACGCCCCYHGSCCCFSSPWPTATFTWRGVWQFNICSMRSLCIQPSTIYLRLPTPLPPPLPLPSPTPSPSPSRLIRRKIFAINWQTGNQR